MSQKTQKIKRQFEREKLKDQAEIAYMASRINNVKEGKLDLLMKAVLAVKDVKCEARTKYIKEAIAVAEGLKLWKTAFQLATIAIKMNDEKVFFVEILKKYRWKENEPKSRDKNVLRNRKVKLFTGKA